MLDDGRKGGKQGDGVQETPLGSPLTEVKDVVVVVNRCDLKTSGGGGGIPFLSRGGVSSSIQSADTYPPIDRGVSIIGKSLNFGEQNETDFKEVIEEQMRIHAESISIFSNEDTRKSLGSDNGSFYRTDNGSFYITGPVGGGGVSGPNVDDILSPQESGSVKQAPLDLTPRLEQLITLRKPPVPLPASLVEQQSATVTTLMRGSSVSEAGSACSLHRVSLASQDSVTRGPSQDIIRGIAQDKL